MRIEFVKMSATGNDFIVLDNRKGQVSALNSLKREKLARRQTGIGADGLLYLEDDPKLDFKMLYFNNDGNEAEMCGNGARAITFFAHWFLKLNNIGKYCFSTNKGVYHSEVLKDELIKLKMIEVYDVDGLNLQELEGFKTKMFLNTGVPHCALEVENLEIYSIKNNGRSIAHNKIFEKGANVNFFEIDDMNKQIVSLRTYEKGVEDETLSCGTGAVATAITLMKKYDWCGEIIVKNNGGELKIQLDKDLKEIYLIGKVEATFIGKVEI